MKTEPNEVLAYITKREWFAGLAMQGLCANPSAYNKKYVDVAIMAIKQADALIEQLNKEKV